MSAALLFVLALVGCARFDGCAGGEPAPTPAATTAPVLPVEVPVAAATDPHAWAWAAVIHVEAGIAAPEVVAPVEAAPVEAAGEELSVDAMRTALDEAEITVWRAAPGAVLAVQRQVSTGAEGSAEGSASLADAAPTAVPAVPAVPAAPTATFTVPADAPAGSWLIATDLGTHRLAWDASLAVQETRVALGLDPWRVIVAVGQDSALGGRSGPTGARARLERQGVVLLQVDAPSLLDVPWTDAPLGQVDLAAVLGTAGSGFILAEAGKAPILVALGRPVALMRRASSYFGISLMPQGAGAQGGGGGPRAGGPGGSAARTGQPGQGRMGQGQGRMGQGHGGPGQGRMGQGPGQGRMGQGQGQGQGQGRMGRPVPGEGRPPRPGVNGAGRGGPRPAGGPGSAPGDESGSGGTTGDVASPGADGGSASGG